MNLAFWSGALSFCPIVSTIAQEQKVSVDLRKAPLTELFSSIERQTPYRFSYRDVVIDENEKVTITRHDTSTRAILESVLAPLGLDFSLTGESIVIFPKKVAAASDSAPIRIQGTVVDEKGEPVIGANVMIKGTTSGTITDMDGNFVLETRKGDVLAISYIGYLPYEIRIDKKNKLAVTLQEDTQALDEVVVVGYGTQKKVNMTGAITAIKTSDLENIPVSNLSNSLAGRAPGVTITNNSGFAGASSSIRIRGSAAEPLYVINGIIRDKTAFDALDPNEVESINILISSPLVADKPLLNAKILSVTGRLS